MVGFGESFFSAFAIFLRATNTQIGLLSALPQMLGSLLQLVSNRLLKFFKSRKRLVCTVVFLQALMYIPVALVFFFGTMKVFLLIAFVSIYWMLGMIANPAWSSWMGDLVDEKRRGTYFGKRNKIAGITSFITFIIAGYILQAFGDGSQRQYLGFAIIFTIALISRLISLFYLTKKYEPRFALTQRAQFSFLDFIEHAWERNYGTFVLYLAFMNLAVYIAAPFFTAYMLNDLKFSYETFAIVTAAAIFVKFHDAYLGKDLRQVRDEKSAFCLWTFDADGAYTLDILHRYMVSDTHTGI
ncbi:MAG: MFS transporter [Nanoarchaeota archaeon]|nr:MFS transporter [Nanoarchaeota archaeon]